MRLPRARVFSRVSVRGLHGNRSLLPNGDKQKDDYCTIIAETVGNRPPAKDKPTGTGLFACLRSAKETPKTRVCLYVLGLHGNREDPERRLAKDPKRAREARIVCLYGNCCTTVCLFAREKTGSREDPERKDRAIIVQ